MKTARRNQAQSVAGGPFEDGQAQEGSPFLLTTTNSINSGDQQIETNVSKKSEVPRPGALENTRRF